MIKVQGSRFFIIRHIHNHASIISSEMQVEFKKNTALHEESEEKKITPRLCSLGSTVWEQEKHLSNTKAHTRHSHRGSESGPASSHLIPQPLIRRWSDPLDQASGSKRTEANGRGGGGGDKGEDGERKRPPPLTAKEKVMEKKPQKQDRPEDWE